MSRYSAIDPTTGTYGDIVCRRHPRDGWYKVYVGDFRLGDVGPQARGTGWYCITNTDAAMLCGLRSVEGFRTRWDAIEYMLVVAGIHGREQYGSALAAADGQPVMSVVCADTIEAGDTVTVCRIPDTDLYYARAHDSYDPATRPAPDDVHTLGVEHYLAELHERVEQRRAREAATSDRAQTKTGA